MTRRSRTTCEMHARLAIGHKFGSIGAVIISFSREVIAMPNIISRPFPGPFRICVLAALSWLFPAIASAQTPAAQSPFYLGADISALPGGRGGGRAAPATQPSAAARGRGA